MPENNVPLSEQAHWKNRDQQVPAKPMSAGARFAIFAIIAMIASGGFYGFKQMKAHQNGSKEMTVLKFNYFGGIVSLEEEPIYFTVPDRETGGDKNKTVVITIPVPNVGVALRSDGKNFTTVLFSHRRDFFSSSSCDCFWKRATILVPNERDLQIWREFLEQARVSHDLYIRSEQEKYKPRRVVPDGWGE